MPSKARTSLTVSSLPGTRPLLSRKVSVGASSGPTYPKDAQALAGHRRRERRRELEKVLYREFDSEHTSLQVDHVVDHAAEGPRLQFLPRIEKRHTR
jgi:hypothetical protein